MLCSFACRPLFGIGFYCSEVLRYCLPVCLPATPRHAPGLGSRKTSKPALVSTSCHISIQQPRAYIAERPRFIHTYIEKGGKWLVAPYVRAAEPPRPRQGGVSPTSVFGRSVGRSVAVPRSGERTTYLPHTLSLFLSLSRTYINLLLSLPFDMWVWFSWLYLELQAVLPRMPSQTHSNWNDRSRAAALFV